MKYLLLIVYIFPVLMFAQTRVKGTVLNSAGDPLPLSNVVVINKCSGTITDEKGVFNLENVRTGDSVRISNVGYKSKSIIIQHVLETDTVYLEDNAIQMDEIVIGDLSKYHREQTLGFSNYSDNGSFQLQPGSQLATYIENENGVGGYIKGISFRLKEFGKCRNSIRLRLLHLDTLTSLPASDILRTNILISSDALKKSNYVDLSRFKISLPYEGIVIVLEWLYPDTKCDRNSYTIVSANLSVPKRLVWLNYRDNTWRKSNLPSQTNGNFMTPNVGVRVGY